MFDSLGREVAVVHDGALGTGTHRFGFDVRALPPGVYVVRATTGTGESTTRRLAVGR